MGKMALRIAMLVALTALLVPTWAAARAETGPQTVRGAKPVTVIKTGNLGNVIVTPSLLGVYYWNVEKGAGGKIRCTGNCAVVWPPVYVTGKVLKNIKGVKATFGSIKRGTKRQLTINGLPAYTYHHDTPRVVLCDNVDGWFAVRPK